MAKELLATYDVRAAGVEAVGRSLSGGNQQKVVVGQSSMLTQRCLLQPSPPVGWMWGAIEFVHGRLLDQRAMGKEYSHIIRTG